MRFLTAITADQFSDNVFRCLAGALPDRLGVAVSGGGDSTALLVLLADWSASTGVVLETISINHGLRPEAAAECQQVADLCVRLKIPHETLCWQDHTKRGNLQDAARLARQSLIRDWAGRRNITAVALGHTLDDQAETVLMRLVRGSGVDGLSAMSERRDDLGLVWIRPLLSTRRSTLRDFLVARDIPWSDDPSNDDGKYDRVRTRKSLALLEELGCGAKGLAETANRQRTARDALEIETLKAARAIANVTATGDVELDAEGFFALADELQSRLLAHALKYVSSSPYRPRMRALQSLLEGVKTDGKAQSLSGCLIARNRKGQIGICREPAAVKTLHCATNDIWDNRWAASCEQTTPDMRIACLGDAGLQYCPDWRETGHGRASLMATPAIWQNDRLIAAPLAGYAQGWSVSLIKGAEHFFSSVLSH